MRNCYDNDTAALHEVRKCHPETERDMNGQYHMGSGSQVTERTKESKVLDSLVYKNPPMKKETEDRSVLHCRQGNMKM